MKKLAILISGRGSNMKAILDSCQNGVLKDVADVSLVFSNKPEAAGLEIAQEYGVETASIPSKGKKRLTFDSELVEFLSAYDFDYIILAGYMRILSPLVIAAYRNRIINIHPADTALHKGLHAYEWAFDTKRKKTTITVHFVDEGVDTGRIIAQRDVELQGAETLDEVEKRGLAVEHQFYSETIRSVLEGEEK